MKILYVVGNRPQFIKLAILHQEVKKNLQIEEAVIHTGQHYSTDMSDIFFKELSINLNVIYLNVNSLNHAAMIGTMMVTLEPEIKKVSPDYIIVFGDTNTTLAGALTGKKMNIPIIHIEAGVRTFEESMPEESNRYITDRIAKINFCCTSECVNNLRKEGFGSRIKSQVIFSGDLMLDIYKKLSKKFEALPNELNDGDIKLEEYILFTLHRKQNLESESLLIEIFDAISELNKVIPVICPLHPNTKKLLIERGIQYDFKTVDPKSYIEMQRLLKHCKYVITDSGGLQREGFFAKKPVLILMTSPFWPEIISHGCALNCESKKDKILESFHKLRQLKTEYNSNCFGVGNASQIIVQTLVEFDSEQKKA